MKFKNLCAAAFALFFTATLCAPTNFEKAKAGETGKIPLDMYLIGGQSNAAGSSLKGALSGKYDNVWYAGETDRSRASSIASSCSIGSFEEYKRSVTAGLGFAPDRIGPEYGMAQVFDEVYTQGKKAFIFKSAAGGTSLLNTASGSSNLFGNWYPRSEWPGDEIDPSSSPMGVQYERFVDNFKKVYETLKENGYAPEVKGMAWMQGEADLGMHVAYEPLVQTLIADIRADLVYLTKDESLYEMPFVIGEIATSFAQAQNPSVPVFNEMQRRVAEETENVYTVPTSDLIIVRADGGSNGPDPYHFSTEDEVTLGNRFGEALLAHAAFEDVSVEPCEHGKVTYTLNADKTQLILTLVPDEGYRLASLSLNGRDVTSSVSQGTYTESKPVLPVSVAAVFEKKEKTGGCQSFIGIGGAAIILPATLLFLRKKRKNVSATYVE